MGKQGSKGEERLRGGKGKRGKEMEDRGKEEGKKEGKKRWGEGR